MWYKTDSETSLYTPSLLVSPERIQENVKRMIRIAGDVSRLRPHVKTHKLGEVVRLQAEMGIRKFKCATLSEVQMTAENGGEDILLAYPLLGPGITRFLALMEQFPGIRFSVVADNVTAVDELAGASMEKGLCPGVFIDIDNGMRRTGIAPGKAAELARFISETEGVEFRGLHIYDGHIHEKNLEEREAHVVRDFEAVEKVVDELTQMGLKPQELACGGTFSFPIHARHAERTLCPGTPILWDAGYEAQIPDLEFLHAAVLAGRIISKPEGNLCLDFGYKAVASEMQHPRLQLLGVEVTAVLNHSEEHLVVSVDSPEKYNVGDVVYALPWHICPTMALHDQVYVVNQNKLAGTWKSAARNRLY